MESNFSQIRVIDRTSAARFVTPYRRKRLFLTPKNADTAEVSTELSIQEFVRKLLGSYQYGRIRQRID